MKHIKHFLSKKAGVTLLEGLIAMALLALVAGGTFGVLLSVSRKTDQPDRREDMAYAVEQVNELLKYHLSQAQLSGSGYDYLKTMLCGDNDPLKLGTHTVNCRLPKSCDVNNSHFSYTISTQNINWSTSAEGFSNADREASAITTGAGTNNVTVPSLKITYDIKCGGFSL